MLSRSDIVSTAEEPIKFFLNYPKGGRYILKWEYERINEPDRYYDVAKKVVIVFVETQIDEDEKETTLEEYSFEDFITGRFEDETLNSIQLITEVYRSKGDSENAWAYKRLLRAFDKYYEHLKNYPDYPEYELLPSSLMTIVEHAIKLYDHMFTFDLIAKVKRRINAEGAVNTGYVIKSEYRHRIIKFNDELIKALVIDRNTKPEQWWAFFRGELPQNKIDWTVKTPCGHLWRFIKMIEESKILVTFPKQQWKFLELIFTFNGKPVPERFYDNHYLSRKSHKALNQAFDTFKS